MCGIGGILRSDGEPIPEWWLDELDRALRVRGPDGVGRFRDRVTVESSGGPATVEVALVHRRLAILDPAGGAQPMVAPATGTHGSLAVVFNGCVYNHRALRNDLSARGHRFRSDHSDTETLLHGWREHRTALPSHVEGMYAFALWDGASASLFLARDPFGEKPIWLVRPAPGVLAFSSVAAPLRRLFPDACGVASPEVVAAFLRRGYGWGRRTDTDQAPLDQLRPGTAMRICADGAIETVRHHAPRGPETVLDDGAEATVDSIERAIDDSVAERLDADVPLACFLSGGVDSAIVAAFARRHVGRLRTFCVRMPDPALDESARAAAIAAHLGTEHVTLDCAATPAEDLVHLLRLVGVPFGDSSLLPTHWVSRAAREEVGVALSGDGGDELFLGYRRHVAARRIVALRPLLRALPPLLAWCTPASSVRGTLARLGDVARDLPHVGPIALASPFPERLVRSLVPDAQVWPDGVPERQSDSPRMRIDPRLAIRAHDLANYLPDDLLLKVDTASMAVALEVRSPLLDRRVAALALRAPIGALLRDDGVTGRKALLRAVARRHLPPSLVDGPKRGFAIPIGRWWRDNHGGLGTLLKDTLLASDPFPALPIDANAMRRLLSEHLDGRVDHGHRLFALLSLSLWSRQIDADPARCGA